MNQPTVLPIEDVQNTPDVRHIAIDKVGIKSIRHPVKVKDQSSGVQHTVALFNMYVHLPHNFKGTHMSRFVEILNMNEREISVENLQRTLANEISAKKELQTKLKETNTKLLELEKRKKELEKSLEDKSAQYDDKNSEHEKLKVEFNKIKAILSYVKENIGINVIFL